MGEEATEESASYFLNYVADKAAQDSDAKFSLRSLPKRTKRAFGSLVFGAAGRGSRPRGVYGDPRKMRLDYQSVQHG